MGIAPEVFEVREDNFLYILDENPPESMRPQMEQAVAALPARGHHASRTDRRGGRACRVAPPR